MKITRTLGWWFVTTRWRQIGIRFGWCRPRWVPTPNWRLAGQINFGPFALAW